MALQTHCLLVLLAVARVTGRVQWKPNPVSQIPKPSIEFFTQKLDHMNFADQRTFSQRYFVHNASFREGGPLFFYTGNEGPLESFYYNTGLPFDWADEFGALIVFGEHRYYGETLPLGNASFDKDKLGYLSISQVLADYALLVTHLSASYGFKGVVAMGGSYGGMLSAWARIKYPNVFDMALAASAPIPQAVNLIEDKATFYKLVTEDASKADPKCPDVVRSAFASVVQKASSAEGLKEISDTFQLCHTMNASELDHFLQYARNAWTEMAMCNYPYPSSFLAPLPAWPVAAACGKVVGAKTPMQGLADAVAMLYRQPNMTCFDMYSIFVECADQTGCGTGKAATAWDYQMLLPGLEEGTEIFYEQNTNNDPGTE
ncbi:Dpp7 [Symbiodinium natans]|uniref:Dpp7 protein n=1 Tax=Symbiodinium natans TaxID=878477 RepID=A0A812J5I2_9DINO|nr:Dpp7 [Symbiodinium natans]